MIRENQKNIFSIVGLNRDSRFFVQQLEFHTWTEMVFVQQQTSEANSKAWHWKIHHSHHTLIFLDCMAKPTIHHSWTSWVRLIDIKLGLPDWWEEMDQVIDSLRFSNKAGQLRSSNCQESHGCHGVTVATGGAKKTLCRPRWVNGWGLNLVKVGIEPHKNGM